MESLFHFIHDAHSLLIVGCLIIAIIILGKSADILVEAAVSLSKKLSIPTVIVGATILSLGTTTPEVVVSVMAAFRGNPGLAMGNAVGSIICDTGLILGLACVIGPLHVDRKAIEWTAWFQLIAGGLLILVCVPFGNLSSIFSLGGSMPQWAGWVFLALLVAYMVFSIFSAKSSSQESEPEEDEDPTTLILGKLFICLVFVILSSELLIHSATELATRMSIPDSVIAATLVAFGTSLPELITALTALKKKQSELAVGNIIGADILNVLFVAGAAATVTPEGLAAPGHFFYLVFPAMMVILCVFRWATYQSKPVMPKFAGWLLLGLYAFITISSFLVTS